MSLTQTSWLSKDLLGIRYQSIGFPLSLGAACQGTKFHSCRWAQIVWAAISVGRPDRSSLMKHGDFSRAERIYRAHLVYANLMSRQALSRRKQAGTGNMVSRSAVYEDLDPSEKGAVSYFLGLTAAKLLAAHYLDVPWLMHLDRHSARFPVSLGRGGTKPDLIGLTRNREWVVIEAKGRSGPFSREAFKKALIQANNVNTIAGVSPVMKIALQTYFQSQDLCVRWQDPDDPVEEPTNLAGTVADLLTEYYQPVRALLQTNQATAEERPIGNRVFQTVRLDGADLRIGLDQEVSRLATGSEIVNLLRDRTALWDGGQFTPDVQRVIGPDGIMVELGPRWSPEQMQQEPTVRA